MTAPIPSHVIHQVRAANVLAIVAQRSNAFKNRKGKGWIGPCPRCGGTDRFAIHPTKGGAIDLSAFLDGLDAKRDFPRIIESIVSATASTQSSNQTARPKADALNVRTTKRLTCCLARVTATVPNTTLRRTDRAAAS